MDQIKKILKWLIPLIVGGLLFWWVYKNMDFTSMKEIFQMGLHYEWIAPYVLLFLLPMIIRGIRWKQLVDPVCPKGRTFTYILAVFSAYGANLLFPRIGEVARCGIMKKYDHLSFSNTLGTVITERAFDVLCLILMAIIAIFSQIGVFNQFFNENPDSADKVISLLLSWKLWTAVGLLVLLIFLGRSWLKKSPFYQKIKEGLRQLWEGMKSIKTMEHPLLFILWTVLIWFFYFLSFYIGQYFFNIPFELGLMAMFTAYVMGSFGVVAPVQGGIGAWHFMVIYSLMFYGISEAQAGSFALIVHGLNTLLTIIFGLVSYGWLMLRK